ncbi:uncharacterized protein [Arachis hypogaea]|uniref:uncharacterized protein isoform X3 n=1 Tax=Arachis hypogaea TaxID=3818 RepID=UPI000DED9730|nr:uncharacterized protein LOC112777312 isoform X3 [Arachis hypogaea]
MAAHLIITGMAFEDGSKKELHKVGRKMSKRFSLSGTSLASMESLSRPLVQEVVLSADMQCEKCQKRVSDIIAKMHGNSDHTMHSQAMSFIAFIRFYCTLVCSTQIVMVN